MTKINKRWLTAGLMALAASFPAAAQATIDFNPATGAAEQPSQPSATTAGAGFHWGDAGIGAAGTILVLGGGSAAVAAGRRRGQRPVAG